MHTYINMYIYKCMYMQSKSCTGELGLIIMLVLDRLNDKERGRGSQRKREPERERMEESEKMN